MQKDKDGGRQSLPAPEYDQYGELYDDEEDHSPQRQNTHTRKVLQNQPSRDSLMQSA